MLRAVTLKMKLYEKQATAGPSWFVTQEYTPIMSWSSVVYFFEVENNLVHFRSSPGFLRFEVVGTVF